MKRALIVIAFLSLVGCSMPIKTANYTFNQGTPACQPQSESLRAATADSTSTGAGSKNSGGSGNTIVIIESSAQDSKADGDPSDAIDAAKTLSGGSPGVLTDVVGDLADPEALEDAGNVVEVE